eukprot:CAMPEP_0184300636 /NCGR_PEP_ID=MMETSP1049-20130417/11009_1 /TAXON_ID=77928 /ORGANISM="Proteomonas sulcata, Strain CCMP704" /LENGTH=279 /DNA_ID=CAMNT_0026611415 /DNA_START=90 /DNA_END=929 /DNA_ORIENTATION=+
MTAPAGATRSLSDQPPPVQKSVEIQDQIPRSYSAEPAVNAVNGSAVPASNGSPTAESRQRLDSGQIGDSASRSESAGQSPGPVIGANALPPIQSKVLEDPLKPKSPGSGSPGVEGAGTESPTHKPSAVPDSPVPPPTAFSLPGMMEDQPGSSPFTPMIPEIRPHTSVDSGGDRFRIATSSVNPSVSDENKLQNELSMKKAEMERLQRQLDKIKYEKKRGHTAEGDDKHRKELIEARAKRNASFDPSTTDSLSTASAMGLLTKKVAAGKSPVKSKQPAWL